MDESLNLRERKGKRLVEALEYLGIDPIWFGFIGFIVLLILEIRAIKKAKKRSRWDIFRIALLAWGVILGFVLIYFYR